MTLSNFDPDTFLRDHWQRKPLLIRGAFPLWQDPIDPDDLAGLACEEDVEARIVTHAGGTWVLENGPFGEDRFARETEDPWTLLVQAVDHYVPDVAALIEPFRFVPDWRIDDVMVSYASPCGGVGPHFDKYDVFLVQGMGQRRWRLGGPCDGSSALLPHDDLRLLADFRTTEEWVLGPGDVLYVPPGWSHDGIAEGGPCMTYSVGFRAPARSALVAHWCDHVLAGIEGDDLYTDPPLTAQDNPGEIDHAALDRLRAMVTRELDQPRAFARWFGQFTSAPKYPDIDWRPEHPITPEQLRALLADGTPLVRNPASRLSFVPDGPDAVMLFADGECFECAGALAGLARDLCAHGELTPDPQLARSEAALALIAALHDQGTLAFDAGD